MQTQTQKVYTNYLVPIEWSKLNISLYNKHNIKHKTNKLFGEVDKKKGKERKKIGIRVSYN